MASREKDSKKRYTIVRREREPPESMAAMMDTMFVSKQKHRTQQRSMLTPKMAFMLSITQSVADICTLFEKNDDEILNRPNMFVAICFDRITDNCLNTFVSVKGRGRDDGRDIATAERYMTHEEKVGVLGGLKRRLRGDKKG